MQFTLCLLAAVEINNVDIVQWLFEHFPDYGVRRKVVYEAASAGAMEILQFFRANRTVIHHLEEEQDEGNEWNEEREIWEKGRWVRWGGLDAAKAALAGHSELVKWMYETYKDTHENRNDFCAMDGAFITGDMELGNWLMDQLMMEPEGHESLHGAAANGHVGPLQWYRDRGIYTSWDAGTLFKAAEAGQLDVVRWILDRDQNDVELGYQSGPNEFDLTTAMAKERAGRILLAWVEKRLWRFMLQPSMGIWKLLNIFVHVLRSHKIPKKQEKRRGD